MSRTEQTAIDSALARATAEMLALPHRVCRRRDCRRNNACSWRFTASGEPCCLQNLTEGERRAFDELYDDATHVRENWRSLPLHPVDANRRDLRDGAAAIVRGVIPVRNGGDLHPGFATAAPAPIPPARPTRGIWRHSNSS